MKNGLYKNIAAKRARIKAGSGETMRKPGTKGALPGQSCYRCFVGDAFDAEDCDTCAADGVLGAMVGMVGTFAAMAAMRVILEGHAALGDPQWGKLHLLDGLTPSLRTMRIVRDEACRGCSASA